MAEKIRTSLTVFISSSKMASATLMSRVLGLVREQIMAALFGASGFTDAFLVAYRIPNLMRDLFAEGAFSSAFVPTFVSSKSESDDAARNLLWALFVLLFIITGLISLGIFVFAPQLIEIFAPTFVNEPEKFEITVNLTRIMAPYLLLVSLAALYMGALNSLKVFFIPALAPVFFNLSTIAAMIFLPDILTQNGWDAVYSLGIGVTIGGLFQGFVQFPQLFSRGFAPKWPRPLIYKQTKEVFLKLGPGLIGFAATQINLIVTTVLASGTIVGAVSWLSYSFRLFQLPIGILSVSIGNSNLVHFSEAWRADNRKEAADYLASSYFLTWLTIIPAIIIFAVYSQEIIHLIFEHGKFNSEDTKMTALALQYYALGLPGYALVKLFVPTLYSLEQHRFAVISSVCSILFNIIFCVLLVPRFGFTVLALGTTLSMYINSLILSSVIKSHLILTLRYFLGWRWFKLIISGLIVAGIMQYAKNFIPFYELNFLQKIFILSIELFIVAFSYILALYLLGERKVINQVLHKLQRKLGLRL